MSFLHPLWFWAALPILAGAVGLWLHVGREFTRRLRAFSSVPSPREWLARRRRRLIVVASAALLLVVALARPLGGPLEQSAQRQGVTLLIALDGSRSMLAEDVAPNRFAQAQGVVDRLLGQLQGDRAGLLLFGGEATLVAPLTFDTVSLQLVNRGLNVELVGRGGSSLAAVIRRATDYFQKKPTAAKVLLLVTDGEETDGDAVIAAQEAWRQAQVRVFTLGVGTAAGGPIPVFERDARRELVRKGHVRDAQGGEVRSRLEAQVLQNVALAAGGSYLDVSAGTDSLGDFYARALRPLAAPLDDVPLRERVEWFQLPLGLALLLLVAEFWWPVRGGRVTPSVALVMAVLGLSDGAPEARAADAQALLHAGRGAEAFVEVQAALLATPDDPLARYNYAVGAYAAGKHSVAAEAFAQLADDDATDAALAARSRAQQGNSFYRLGESLRTANPAGSVVWWEQALAAYARVPDVAWAAANLAKTRTDLLALRREIATERERAGDAAARVSPDKGVEAWREAVTQLDAAQPLATALEAESEGPVGAEIAAARATVNGKIVRAFLTQADDKRRRAERQRKTALERAIELMEDAGRDYAEALRVQPEHEAARAGQAKAVATLVPWIVELAEAQQAAGERARDVALAEAMTQWQKAAANFERALKLEPGNEAALRGQARNRAALHAGWLALGDAQWAQAAEPGRAPAEQDKLREAALGHFRAALALVPDDAATLERIARLGREVVGVFAVRGQRELAEGRGLADEKPPEAIAWLERAVQSFAQALSIEAAHAAAREGRAEAVALLQRLRDRDAADQRKMLAENKTIADPQALEDPGELALKLLDYEHAPPASRKPQDYTAPDTILLKNW